MTQDNSSKKPENLSPRKPPVSLEVVYNPGYGWVYIFENRHNQTVNGDKVAKIWRESMGR